jgi:ABC-type microcin C transport system permease subunit YejE
MENKRILSAIIGISQGIIGAAFGVLAVMFGLNIREVQTVFNMPPEFLPLDLLILGLFSAFSLISGLFLIREWRG